MKKQFYTIAALLLMGIAANAQVGINTNLPAATLDVTGTPATATVLDGIIAPRMTGAQLRAKTYTVAQTGAIVYATVADTAPAGQTIDVTAAGQYYFNGTKWVSMTPVSFTEADGIIGNEVTNITANGGLTRAGSGTTVSPYTLGLTSGTASGQVMTWNGTLWQPATLTNIYTASGSLTATRNLSLNGFQLNFNGTAQSTTFNPSGSLYQRGLANQTPVIVVSAVDGSSNFSQLSQTQAPGGASRLYAGHNSSGLVIGSTGTALPTGIQFTTSPGGNIGLDDGITKMTLTSAGNFGINQTAPAAKLHVVKAAADITPAIIAGCNTYTDNAAATTAGVPVGGLYRKADGTLMVRF